MVAETSFIIGGVALLGVCITILIYKDKILDAPINKTDEEILNILKGLNPTSSNISNDIDDICRLQRRKKHMHKDIQNTLSLFVGSSFGLIMISLVSVYSAQNDFLKTITTILILIVGLLFFLGFCFIIRFCFEVNKMKKTIIK